LLFYWETHIVLGSAYGIWVYIVDYLIVSPT
jgi:hypothetical protein